MSIQTHPADGGNGDVDVSIADATWNGPMAPAPMQDDEHWLLSFDDIALRFYGGDIVHDDDDDNDDEAYASYSRIFASHSDAYASGSSESASNSIVYARASSESASSSIVYASDSSDFASDISVCSSDSSDSASSSIVYASDSSESASNSIIYSRGSSESASSSIVYSRGSSESASSSIVYASDSSDFASDISVCSSDSSDSASNSSVCSVDSTSDNSDPAQDSHHAKTGRKRKREHPPPPARWPNWDPRNGIGRSTPMKVLQSLPAGLLPQKPEVSLDPLLAAREVLRERELAEQQEERRLVHEYLRGRALARQEERRRRQKKRRLWLSAAEAQEQRRELYRSQMQDSLKVADLGRVELDASGKIIVGRPRLVPADVSIQGGGGNCQREISRTERLWRWKYADGSVGEWRRTLALCAWRRVPLPEGITVDEAAELVWWAKMDGVDGSDWITDSSDEAAGPMDWSAVCRAIQPRLESPVVVITDPRGQHFTLKEPEEDEAYEYELE